ncbi:restriction endonuclease subunit S [Segatella copri]|uniref:restriction endonuclease subunit S n=1 Tax=Segatella copri TaxID=165179 RepID=UPI003D0384EF
MRKGWEYKRFTEVCDVTYGYAFDSKCFTDNPEDTPLIRIRDVKRGFSETFYNGEIPDGYKVMEGDYLVGMDGEFNIGQWGKRPGVLNQRVCKMNSSSSELINQYMYYFMKVCLKSIEDETPFVTVKHLSAKRINQIQIPLPPLSTQLAIVSELDKINELIRLKKEQLKDFDNLAQSLFYEMFGDPVENEKGWEVKKLGEIAKSAIGLTYKPENVTEELSGTVVLRSSNIQNSILDFNDIVRVNVLVKEDKMVNDGDILMCSRNGSFRLVGKVALIKGLKERMSYGAFMTIIRSPYNPYLFEYFKTPAFRQYLITGKTTTVNQITVKMLNNLTLPLPPLSLQRLFAQRIEQIEREKSEVQKSIQDLETLLASRMQYWFE